MKPVIINGLQDALVVAATARSFGMTVDLITEPGASAYIGAGMFFSVVRDVRAQAPEVGAILYDCGARRGDVLAGLHAGLKQLCMDEGAIIPALLDLAGQHGATIFERPKTSFQPQSGNLAQWLQWGRP